VIYLILFFLTISVSVLIVIGSLSYTRMKMGEDINKPLIIQPYSNTIVSKNYLISLAFLETPIILTVVVGILVFDLFNYTGSVLLQILPSLYLLLFSLSSAISIFYSGISLPSLFLSFGSHPQFESQFLMQFLLLSSSIQAPFIIFFVSIFYHKYYIISNINTISLFNGSFTFICFHFLMLLIIQFALVKGISKIINQIGILYVKYPENCKHIFILLIMQIGFLQAPFIFAFICFILLFKVFSMHLIFLYYLFSFLAFCFGINGYTVINQSSNLVTSGLKNSNHKIEKNKLVIGFSLISQILLDSRILYILLIILFSINFFT
jgi:hypothetical protein